MKRVIKIALHEVLPRWRDIVFIIILIFLVVGLEALAPWPFKILLDNVFGGEKLSFPGQLGKLFKLFSSRESLGFFTVLLYSVCTSFISIIEYFSSFSIKKLSSDLVNTFAQTAFRQVELIAPGYYKKQQIGDYIYRLSYDTAALGNLFEAGLLPLITNSLYAISTMLIMFFIHPALALLALIIVPFLTVSLWVFNHQIGVVSKRSEQANSALFSFVEEILNQLKIVQAYNQQKREARLFAQQESVSLGEDVHLYGLNFLLNLLIGLVVAIGYAIVIMYGINAVFLGTLSAGLLIVFIFYLDNLTNPLLALMTAASYLRQDYVKLSRLNDFFSLQFRTNDNGPLTAVPRGDIQFDKVTLLGDEGVKILHSVSFTIPAGKKTVIIGPSGSGKTTLIALILRFIEPSSGQIRLDGGKISQYSLNSWREAIAYVPQEITLFNDTIRNNIDFGAPRSPFSSIRRAAQRAVADQFIRHLPGGYNFVSGEEGLNLSGGQRQRIMLARAFIKEHAHFLIFDEPLSALDIKTRSALLDNLLVFSEGKTTILVSNILEIVNQTDYALVINEGKIVYAGHSKQLSLKGYNTLLLESH